MNSSTPAAMVRATLRLQFRAGLTLDDATALVPQFARLGISHLYASPLFAARPGSTHGYDTVAHDRIDPALGGEAALTRLADRLHAHGMGLILDIVPNHMAVDAHNAWWMDVLAWGQASAHATWFDIDWHDPDPDLRGRVLLPFLDRPLPEAIVAGSLVLRHDGDGGLFHIHHHEHRFPLCPASYAGLLAQVEAPGALLAAFTTVAVRGGPGAEADSALAALRHWAATQRGQAAMARLATLHDGCDPAGRARLEGLLAVQSWLLACWREAATRINWRRFLILPALWACAWSVPRCSRRCMAACSRFTSVDWSMACGSITLMGWPPPPPIASACARGLTRWPACAPKTPCRGRLFTWRNSCLP
ncbi:alpha-amylase family glycosyl hydrolase [Komagataeibacter nataicola]|uniref:alpha-amylase family glycosyl hydrolase n=1 Tax=Komagataeibacter nataicola TaxID=265960 RepID=UPI0028ADB1BA|nr:alpha-amylase family glycosyl hydrolase [Komagataeibacter nataicola]WNM08296.1 alpha-amylase family glycosyl hydrolase [Komagataeibacter nataicola]